MSAKDKVRLLIGDTDVTANSDLCLQYEEIEEFLLLEAGSTTTTSQTAIYKAAAGSAEALAAKWVRKLDIGADKGNQPSRAAELRATARNLRARAGTAVVPYAGGLSASDISIADANTDRPEPAFRRGMLDGCQ
jgi:hypothetical protein